MSRSRSRVSYKFTFYILVYIICWPLDIANSIIYYAMQDDQRCHLYVLICIYSALLNSEGFLNYLVYGFTNKRIRAQFCGSSRLATLKSICIFILSPLLLPAVSAWYLGRQVRTCLCAGASAAAKEEQEKEQLLRQARQRRLERSAQIQRLWSESTEGSSGAYSFNALSASRLTDEEAEPVSPVLPVKNPLNVQET